jgi:hypothetical protein
MLSAEAKVKLPVLISDGMVLQREQPVKIWGTADAGESVQLQFLGGNFPETVKGEKWQSVVTALADEQGNWCIALLPFKGVVWYQGESNVGNRNWYAALLTALIGDWRAKFNNPQLPFYIVELADFMKNDKAWKEMQTIQTQAAKSNLHTKFIRNSDLGEWNDIHPLAKKPLGERIAESVWETMNEIQLK